MAVKRVFISFDYDNDLAYKNLLLAWDKNKDFDFRFYDASLRTPINSTDASYIKSRIKPRIKEATHLLCIVGKHSHKSSWIDWEIEVGIEERKKLIGVKLDRSYTSPSRILNAQAKWAMSFTFESIKSAINQY